MSNIFDYTFFDDPNWFNNTNNDLFPYSNASGFLSSCSYPPVPTSILRSNCAPSQTDVTQTNAILQEEQQELQRYDEEIRRSRLVLESLEAERDLLDQKMQERRSWLAPIRRLSKEVLGKIFAVTVGLSESDFSLAVGYDYGDDESDDEYSSSVQAPALALSHVSSHWRNVACEQPSIWSSIHLELHKMEADFTPLLQVYLNNSGDHPLTICVTGDYEVLPIAISDIDEAQTELGAHTLLFLKVLAKHLSRCQDLSLSHMQPDVWMQDSEVSFPNLHTLSLRNDGVPFTEDHFWNAIRNAPLRCFTTDEVQQCVSIGVNHTLWSQLKSLTIHNLDGSMDFHFIITHCLQLEELLMGITPGFPGEDWSGDIQPVVLPSLRKLDLRSGSKPQFCFVLDSLVLPSLQIFHARVSYGEPMTNLVFRLDSLFYMLQRSADVGSLKELHLLDLPWDRNFSMKWFPTLLRILEHSSCLESLKLSFQRPYTAVYPRNPTDSLGDVSFIASLFPVLLIPSSRSQALLPRLRDIEIHEHLESCSPQLSIFILEMIEERTRAKLDANARADVSALKNVFICTDPLQCWKQASENPLSAVQERLVALGNVGTICRIYSKRKVEISGKQ